MTENCDSVKRHDEALLPFTKAVVNSDETNRLRRLSTAIAAATDSISITRRCCDSHHCSTKRLPLLDFAKQRSAQTMPVTLPEPASTVVLLRPLVSARRPLGALLARSCCCMVVAMARCIFR